MFSNSEATRRIRYAAKLARQAAKVAPNTRAEMGTRVKPQRRKAAPTTRRAAMMACHPKDDDLVDQVHIDTAARTDEVREPGAVVHLYLHGAGRDGELEDVVVVWMGTPEDEPRVIDPRFVDY